MVFLKKRRAIRRVFYIYDVFAQTKIQFCPFVPGCWVEKLAANKAIKPYCLCLHAFDEKYSLFISAMKSTDMPLGQSNSQP